MLRHIFLILFGMVAASQVGSQQPQMINPKDILFTVPTISDELAVIEHSSEVMPKDALVFHEDDWRQVEFVPATRLPEIKKMMSEYRAFEAQNRTGSGWRSVYVRQLKSQKVVEGKNGSARIAQLVNGKIGNSLFLASSSGYGRVQHGFSIDLGGNINLYGTVEDAGVSNLGADVGRHPDDSKLTKAFSVLQKRLNVVLVDWKAQIVLVSTSTTGNIEVWRP